MRKLEERSSPMLKVLMVQGRYEISQRDIFFLRRWAIKTAAVFEAFDGNLHTSDQLRKTLRNGSSPDDVAVILGAYKGNTMLMHSRSVYADPQQNGQTVTWVTLVAGSMVLFVFNEFTRHKSVNLRPEVQAHFVQLAKSDPSPISWPYGNPIHDDLLDVASRGPNPEMRLD